MSSLFSFEPWEIDLVNKVAQRYSKQVDFDDLQSDLQLHLMKLKKMKTPRIKDWKAYLASSLFHRANRFLLQKRRESRELISLEEIVLEGEADFGITIENVLGQEEEVAPVPKKTLVQFYAELSRYDRKLWDLLIEEEGDISGVARRLKQPRTTVDYHVQKLRKRVKDQGFSV